jgi:esterase/lipase superfamily enzyme
LAVIENPQAPTALFPMASTNLTTANALTYINRQVFAKDLNIIAHSNGAHWYREDTGAMII